MLHFCCHWLSFYSFWISACLNVSSVGIHYCTSYRFEQTSSQLSPESLNMQLAAEILLSWRWQSQMVLSLSSMLCVTRPRPIYFCLSLVCVVEMTNTSSNFCNPPLSITSFCCCDYVKANSKTVYLCVKYVAVSQYVML